MSRWRAFVDVLDEILTDRDPVATPSLPDGRVRAGATTSPLYSFGSALSANRFWKTSGPYTPSAPAYVAAPSASTAAPRHRSTFDEVRAHAADAEPRQRTSRMLGPAEETALQTLVRLGAALDRGFTSRELRSTFRALAQRYHPDRHPHASDAERMRLGTTFAELTQAYGVLHDATL